MSIHRDDHEAALARADALEEELQRVRHAADAAQRLAELAQREADAMRRELAARGPAPEKMPAPPKRTSLLVPPRQHVATPIDPIEDILTPQELARRRSAGTKVVLAMIFGLIAIVTILRAVIEIGESAR